MHIWLLVRVGILLLGVFKIKLSGILALFRFSGVPLLLSV
jgi:hypothetical protein